MARASSSEIKAQLSAERGDDELLPVGEALFGSLADTGECASELREQVF
jgi:hypothetical protein